MSNVSQNIAIKSFTFFKNFSSLDNRVSSLRPRSFYRRGLADKKIERSDRYALIRVDTPRSYLASFLPLKIESFGHLNAAFGSEEEARETKIISSRFRLSISTGGPFFAAAPTNVSRNRCQINRIERQNVKLRTEQRSWKHRCSVATESDLRLKGATNVILRPWDTSTQVFFVRIDQNFFHRILTLWQLSLIPEYENGKIPRSNL